MNPSAPVWTSVEREVKGEIMKTDVFVKIVGPAGSEAQMARDLDAAFTSFQSFEQRFSRFREESELTRFNRSSGGPVSDDLFELLSLARRAYDDTQGLFDPSVLPVLHTLGYRGAEPSAEPQVSDTSFEQLQLDKTSHMATKPLGLQVDLGGIGKGYIVDRVARFLRDRGHTDFVVDAGGDIYASGVNREEGYPYWAFDIEHPLRRDESVATVLLSDEAVATSGRNRRTWQAKGETKHHLIDPRTKDSVANRLATVSVIAPSTLEADIWAKTLFILGEEAGLAAAGKCALPALFIGQDERLRASPLWQGKTWDPAAYQDIMQSLCTNFSSGTS